MGELTVRIEQESQATMATLVWGNRGQELRTIFQDVVEAMPMSRNEEAHLEKEFEDEDYDKLYPRE